MIVQGYIFDDETNTAINNAIIRVVDLTISEKIGEPLQLGNNGYSIQSDSPDEVAISFTAAGFKSATIPMMALSENPNVYLQKSISVLPVLLATGLILATANKQRSVGKITRETVVVGVMIIAAVKGVSILDRIMEFFGLKKSQDTKDLDGASSDPNSFWNPMYWSSIKPPDKPWSYAITEEQARGYVKEITDAFGAFNDCEECVIGIFKKFRTKANASFLAWVFQKETGQDMLKYLRGVIWPQDRLSDADVNLINKYINNLPNY